MFRRLHIIGLLASLVLALGCGREDSPTLMGSPLAALSPQGAAVVVVTAPLSDLRVGFLHFVVNVDGLLGLVDLGRQRLDLDLAAEDCFQRVGLDPTSPLALLWYGAEGACLGLDAGNARTLEGWFARVLVNLNAKPEAALGPLAGNLGTAGLALEKNANIYVLGYHGTAGAAGAQKVAQRCLTAKPSGNWPTLKGLVVASRPGPLASLPPEFDTWIPGPAGAIVMPLLRGAYESVTGVQAHLTSNLEGASLTVDLEGKPGLGLLAPTAQAVARPLSTRMPGATAAFLLFQDGAAKNLAGVVGEGRVGLLGFMLPRLGVDAKLVEPLQKLLHAAGPDLGVFLLGLADEASPAALATATDAAGLLTALRAGLVLEGDFHFLEPLLADYQVPGYVQETAAGDGTLVSEWCRKRKGRPCLGLGLGEDVLVVASGKGDAARALEAALGKAPALASGRLFDGTAALRLGLNGKALVWQARAKGVPPYYLGILNSFMAATAFAKGSPKGATLGLELELR
jgi:hypothetical protein